MHKADNMNIAQTKPIKRLTHSLTYGNLWLYILSLIKKRKKMYGYSLDKEIEKTFGFKPNMIMLYVVLYKLEDEKLIHAEFEQRRKYYTLTEKGRKALGYGKGYLSGLGKRL